MDLIYGPHPNGTDSELRATNCGPGPHAVELRALPSGSFLGQQPDEWQGMEDVVVLRFGGNETPPEAIRVRAYGSVEGIVEYGKTLHLDPPEKIEEGEDIANFTQVEDRPIVEVHDLAAPWEGYDDATVGDIKDRVDDLEEPALNDLRQYEAANKNRKGVLHAVDHAVQSKADGFQAGDVDVNVEVAEDEGE